MEKEEEEEEEGWSGAEKKKIRMDASAVIHELPDCIVKVYDVDVFEYFKVNHSYEFVGVLDYSPEEKDCGMEIDDSDAFYKSIAAKNPPRSMVPRVHALTFRNIEIGNGNPMFALPYSSSSSSSSSSVATESPLKVSHIFRKKEKKTKGPFGFTPHLK